MHEYDIALKELLLDASGATLRELLGVDIRRWRDVELPQVTNPRIDLLGETDTGSLAHIELQSTNDPEMGVRMLNYALRIYDQHRRFPQQIVLYVGNAPLRMAGELSFPGLRYEYRVADIRALDGERLCESPAIGDNIIAILARWPDRTEAVRRILARIAEREPARRSKAFAQLFVLSGLRKLAAVIEREVKQMPIMDDILDHEVLGREYKRGRRDDRIELLRMQLEERFGPLTPMAEQRLNAASNSELREIAKRLLRAACIDEAFE